jgi:hypothetical protein
MTDGRFTIGLVASAEMNALRRTTDLVVQSALTRRENITLATETGARQIVACAVSPGFFELGVLARPAGIEPVSSVHRGAPPPLGLSQSGRPSA